MLKESAEARNFNLSLAPYGMSDDLMKDLTKHAAFLEDSVKQLQQLIMKKSTDEAAYKTIMDAHDSRAD
eukprot:15446778-Alexandrium_andersonii.AAC.1